MILLFHHWCRFLIFILLFFLIFGRFLSPVPYYSIPTTTTTCCRCGQDGSSPAVGRVAVLRLARASWMHRLCSRIRPWRQGTSPGDAGHGMTARPSAGLRWIYACREGKGHRRGGMLVSLVGLEEPASRVVTSGRLLVWISSPLPLLGSVP